MERESLRAGLNGSPLIGLLSRLALLEGPAAAPSVVQGLGQWLGWADAIPLSAALQPASRPASKPSRGAAPAEREFERVRALLQQRIDDEASPRRRKDSPADQLDIDSYRQRYAALQLAMQSAIEPLRATLRAALAQRSVALQQVAALDEVLEPVLAARQQALLALMPTLLERHFERLRQQAAATWREQFHHDLRQLLSAELQLRLQPLQGLVDTLRNTPANTL